MRSVISQVPAPSGQRKVVSPAEVLFKRGVRVASVSAAGATTTQVSEFPACSSPARPCGPVSRDPRIPVSLALSVLRSRVCSVASCSNDECASEAFVASPVASQSFVASEFPLRITRQSGQASPLSMLPLVLKALSRRAVAAKVSRGRRRLDPAGRNQSGQSAAAFVASRLSEVASCRVVSSARSLRSSGSVALVSGASASCWVASAFGPSASALGASASAFGSVASRLVPSRIAERTAPQSESPQRISPRIVH